MGDLVDPLSHSKRQRTVNVLVTGFGAFRNTNKNPSWETAKLLSKRSFSGGDDKHISIDISYIPTEYEFTIQALDYFHGLIEDSPKLPDIMINDPIIGARSDFDPRKRYDLVLHIGQGRSGGIVIETVGHQTGYDKLDATNSLAPFVEQEKGHAEAIRGHTIVESVRKHLVAGDELVTSIDTTKLATTISEQFPEIQIFKSEDAGHYLCDFIYFGSMAAAIQAQAESEVRGLTLSKPKVLFVHVSPEHDPLSIVDMANVLQGIIEEVTSTISGGRSGV